MFDTVSDESIRDGTATDAYFLRTEDALDELDHNPNVVADIAADQFSNGEPEVFAGVNDVIRLLGDLDVELDVWSIPEGTQFDGGSVLRIAGKYRDFARYETSILGFLSHASGIATNAYEVVQVAEEFDDRPLILSFGARHVHPKIAPVVERSALLAGFDGFSHVAAGNVIDREPSGTTPHALILSVGNQEDAWSAFNDSAPDDVPRIVIADTLTDEADEAVRAAKELGSDLDGVRLDTTGSRRGDFKHIIKEVRWKLDEIGRQDVGIFVSGGLGPSDVRDLGHLVEGFGIGGYVSNADPVDFSLDIVENQGQPITKRGKLQGIKSVRWENNEYIIERSNNCSAGLFEPVIEDGNIVKTYDLESISDS